jgi:hypothetical protein
MPWGTWWVRKAVWNSCQLMLPSSSWLFTYASNIQLQVLQASAKQIKLSRLLHYMTWSFFSIVLSYSSASMGSTECKKMGGLVLWNSPTLSCGWGCGAGWWPWVGCIFAIICCMVCNIYACMLSTCSSVGGGGGFPWLLSLLAFALRLLVMAIWSTEEFMIVEMREAIKMIGENMEKKWIATRK